MPTVHLEIIQTRVHIHLQTSHRLSLLILHARRMRVRLCANAKAASTTRALQTAYSVRDERTEQTAGGCNAATTNGVRF